MKAAYAPTWSSPPWIIIINVTVPFEEPDHFLVAHAEKVHKYSYLDTTLPFVVGSLGS